MRGGREGQGGGGAPSTRAGREGTSGGAAEGCRGSGKAESDGAGGVEEVSKGGTGGGPE